MGNTFFPPNHLLWRPRGVWQLPIHLDPHFPEAGAELFREAESQGLCWGERWHPWDIGCRWSRDGGAGVGAQPLCRNLPMGGTEAGVGRGWLRI